MGTRQDREGTFPGNRLGSQVPLNRRQENHCEIPLGAHFGTTNIDTVFH